jgi:hypothetical protein
MGHGTVALLRSTSKYFRVDEVYHESSQYRAGKAASKEIPL